MAGKFDPPAASVPEPLRITGSSRIDPNQLYLDVKRNFGFRDAAMLLKETILWGGDAWLREFISRQPSVVQAVNHAPNRDWFLYGKAEGRAWMSALEAGFYAGGSPVLRPVSSFLVRKIRTMLVRFLLRRLGYRATVMSATAVAGAGAASTGVGVIPATIAYGVNGVMAYYTIKDVVSLVDDIARIIAEGVTGEKVTL